MKFQSFNHMSLSSGGEGPIGVLGGQRPSQHTVHSYVLLNEQCYRFSNALGKISTYIINTRKRCNSYYYYYRVGEVFVQIGDVGE